MIGNYFITPHAVRKFQERVARLPYDEVVSLIAKALSAAPVKKHGVTQNGRAMVIRVTDPLDFRAVIVPGQTPQFPQPAVVTVLKSGKPRHRQAKLARYMDSR